MRRIGVVKGAVLRRVRLGVVIVLLVVGATSLIGQPDNEIYYTYYTDATYTVQCGYTYITCTGIRRSGCQTEFATVFEGPACQNQFCWDDTLQAWIACG